MESLPLIRTILLAAADVTAKRSGDLYLNGAPEGAALPNVVLMSVGGGEGMSHDGPDGLLHERVRIWARAATPKAAGELCIAIDKALHGYSGTVSGAAVRLVEKVMTTSDFDDKATVQRAIIDFRIHWNRAP
jgi:hypothetical protein